MDPDRQKVWKDGRMEWTDGRTDHAKTISLLLRQGILKQSLIGCDHYTAILDIVHRAKPIFKLE